MPKFNFNFTHSLGWSHMGDVTAEAKGAVEFSDEELAALVALMKSKNSQDVGELNLEEELPEVYQKLDEAIREAVVEAERHHWLLGGFYEGAYEYDVYEVMEYCEENCGFEFIYDEEEHMDEDGELDEDALEDARQEAFDEWLPGYLEMLDVPECCAFIEEQLNGEVEVDEEMECEVFIPHEIIKLAGM